MSRNLLLSAITILCLAFLLVPNFTQGKPPQPTAKPSADMVKRGQYLVTFGGCNDCHTPKKFGPKGPEPDMTKMLSGHPADQKLPEIPAGVLGPDKWGAVTTNDLTAWAGPWGISFAQNITPDQETGIGSWTEEMFISTMRTGKHLGKGRDILPPMPWFDLNALTDDDLKAVFAYLRSIPPVKNVVPEAIPPKQ